MPALQIMNPDSSTKSNVFKKIAASWRSSSQENSSPPSMEMALYTGPMNNALVITLAEDYCSSQNDWRATIFRVESIHKLIPQFKTSSIRLLVSE